MTLTAKDVAEITRLLEESNFDELHLELDGLKLTLRRGATPSVETASHDTPRPPTATPEPAPTAVQAPAPTKSVGENVCEVTAPMLGTFYRAPKPGAQPYVEVGARVEEETIVCIIEVMKLMHTVRAGVSGTVTAIFGRDGTLVEFGEVLLSVARDA